MIKLTKEQILEWCRKYDTEEDQYNAGLETELGNKLRAEKELDKEDLIKIIEWKFQGRLLGRRKIILNLIENVSDSDIRKIIKEGLTIEDEQLRIKLLMDIRGIGVALASVILTFYDPKDYGVFDIHVYDELFGTSVKTRPKDMFTNLIHYVKLLEKLRKIANRHQLDVRVVEKALFKKNYDESKK
jgi:thermostable 8-oxoguanine DNA glycosylase